MALNGKQLLHCSFPSVNKQLTASYSMKSTPVLREVEAATRSHEAEQLVGKK